MAEREGKLLSSAREAAQLTLEGLAALAEVDAVRLRDAERGVVELSVAELDQCTQVFGIESEDLFGGVASTSPLAVFLRSEVEEHQLAHSRISSDVAKALGEFARVVNHFRELDDALQVEARLPRPELLPKRPDEHEGDRHARSARRHFGLGDSQIPSMRDLVEKDLGIRVVWVTEDHVDRVVDGASTSNPRPAILINLIEPGSSPWRARMTLAHELCHLLFDQATTKQIMVSPHVRWPALDQIEQRARAFAACFLAPTDGIRSIVGSIDPASEEAIGLVGSEYGIGRTAAINRLRDVFGLADSQRYTMEVRVPKRWDAAFSQDLPAEPLGFRGASLLNAIEGALDQRAITPSRARRMLRLGSDQPLPFDGLPAELVQAPVSREEVVRRKAQRILDERYPNRGLWAKAAKRTEGWWVVGVTTAVRPDAGPMDLGCLTLHGDGSLKACDVKLPDVTDVP